MSFYTQASHEAEMEDMRKSVEETTRQLKVSEPFMLCFMIQTEILQASIQARDDKIYQLCKQIQVSSLRS